MPRKAKASSRSDQSFVIIPDTHAPYIDALAWNCVLAAIRKIQPYGVIHLGDIGEWDSVSHWRWSRQKRPPLEYLIQSNEDDEPGLLDKEAASVNAMLDELDAACSDAGVEAKFACIGNHDDWLTRFCTEFPYVRKRYNPVALMNLEVRGYRVTKFEADVFPTVGKSPLVYYHGHHVAGVHHARNHLLRFGVSLVYGHHHDQQQASIQQVGGYHSAWSIGCLRKREETFLRGRPNNWSHGFGIANVSTTGKYQLLPHTIVDGRTWVHGEQIDGGAIAKERAA